MFGTNLTKTFTLGGTLDKISKFLNIANQAIPIYKEIKPIFNNTKKVFSLVKEINKIPNKKTIEAKVIDKPTSNLTFFQ